MPDLFPWPDESDRAWLAEFGLEVVKRTDDAVWLESPHVRIVLGWERGQVLGEVESRSLNRSFGFGNVVRALNPGLEFRYREPGTVDRGRVHSECKRLMSALGENAVPFLRGDDEAHLRVDELSQAMTRARWESLKEYSRTRRQELRDASGPDARVDVRELAWPTEADAGWMRDFELAVTKREEHVLVLGSPRVALSFTLDGGEISARLHAPPASEGCDLALLASVMVRGYLLRGRALLPLDPAAAVAEFGRLSAIAREKCTAYLRGEPETIQHVNTGLEIYRKARFSPPASPR